MSEFVSRAPGQAEFHQLVVGHLGIADFGRKVITPTSCGFQCLNASFSRLLICTEYTTHEEGRLSSCRKDSHSIETMVVMRFIWEDRIVAELSMMKLDCSTSGLLEAESTWS